MPHDPDIQWQDNQVKKFIDNSGENVWYDTYSGEFQTTNWEINGNTTGLTYLQLNGNTYPISNYSVDIRPSGFTMDSFGTSTAQANNMLSVSTDEPIDPDYSISDIKKVCISRPSEGWVSKYQNPMVNSIDHSLEQNRSSMVRQTSSMDIMFSHIDRVDYSG